MRYRVSEESGASTIIEAYSDDEADLLARDWILEGSYEPELKTFWVKGYLEKVDDDDEPVEQRYSFHVPFDPETPPCLPGHCHDWQSPWELVGGLKENPGVISHGGGIKKFSACMNCGCGSVYNSWDHCPTTGYSPLESWEYIANEYEVKGVEC